MDLQGVEWHAGVSTTHAQGVWVLLRLILTSQWAAPHSCGTRDCRVCEARVMCYQLALELVKAMNPLETAHPPDVSTCARPYCSSRFPRPVDSYLYLPISVAFILDCYLKVTWLIPYLCGAGTAGCMYTLSAPENVNWISKNVPRIGRLAGRGQGVLGRTGNVGVLYSYLLYSVCWCFTPDLIWCMYVVWPTLCVPWFQLPVEEAIEEGTGRKSPPDSERKASPKSDMLNMAMPFVEVHTVGGVLVHMPHVSTLYSLSTLLISLSLFFLLLFSRSSRITFSIA